MKSHARASIASCISLFLVLGCTSDDALPEWAIPPGAEFWRAPASSPVVTAAERPYASSFENDALRFVPAGPPEAPPAELTLRTRSIRRGDSELLGRTSAQRFIRGDLAQRALDRRSQIVEHLVADARGVELTWLLHAEPAGQGPLTVELETAGLAPAGRSARGHHFADPSGKSRVRISDAVLVDASGERWKLPLESTTPGLLAVVVPEDLLLRARYPLAIDPLVSAEFGMDDVVPGYPAYNQPSRDVACGGGTCLAAWGDELGSYVGTCRVARIDSSGTVLDAAPLSLHDVDGDCYSPSVAFDGTNFLVSWLSVSSSTTNGLRGRYVTPAGTVLGPSFRISLNGNVSEVSSTPGPTGSVFLTWNQTPPGVWNERDVHGAQVTGGVVDWYVAVSTAAADQDRPKAAFDGTNYAVVWRDYRVDTSYGDIYGGRISPAGIALDGSGKAIITGAGPDWRPELCAGAGQFLVTFRYGSVRAARLSPTLTSLDGAGKVVFSSAYYDPVCAFDGTNHLVIGGDRRGRMSTAGALLDGTGVSGTHPGPAAAFDGTNYLLLHSTSVGNANVTAYQRLSPANASLDPTPRLVTGGSNGQKRPGVAYDGTHYLSAWIDHRDSTAKIYATRLSDSGAVLDPAGIFIGSSVHSFSGVEVAGGGGMFLVTWMDPGNLLKAARVTSAGMVLDTTAITLNAAQGSGAHAVWDGSDFLVVYSAHNGTNVQDVFARRIPASGPPGAQITVRAATGQQTDPHVACIAPGNCLVVFTHDNGSNQDVYRARIQGTSVSNVGQLFTENGYYSAVGIATNGSLYMARTSGGYLRVDAAGSALNAAPFGYAELGEDLVYDGKNFVYARSWNGYTEIDAGQLTASGQLVNQNAPPVLTGEAITNVRLAATPTTRRVMMVYEAWDPVVQNLRAKARFLSFLSPPDAPSRTETLYEDGTRSIFLPASDSDGDPVTVTIDTPPSQGTLTGTPPYMTYKPDLNFSGQDSFTYVASDGTHTSTPGTITLVVNPVNDVPVAQAQPVALDEDVATPIVLSATDVDGDPLTYEVVQPGPAHGVLSGTAPNLVYTPASEFSGTDSFSFRVFDGKTYSATAPVTITVAVVDDPPVADSQSVVVTEDGQVAVQVTASDVDSASLTWMLETGPTNGVLTGTLPSVTYVPNADFNGNDAFTFRAQDGTSSSGLATVSITVTPANDAPTAHGQALTFVQGEPLDVNLTGSDVDGDALSFTVSTPPAEGALTGTPPQLTFVPPAGFRGNVSFEFVASDGQITSSPATVVLTIANGAPVVTMASDALSPLEGAPVQFSATAADPGGDALTFSWDFGDGSTGADQPEVSHTFENEGTYEVTVTVSDGVEIATASLAIEVQNAAPIVVPSTESVSGEEGQALTFAVEVSDPGASDTWTVTWDWGDGSEPSAGETGTHRFADDGVYEVSVTVADDAGAMTVSEREVTISNLPPIPSQQETLELKPGEGVSATLHASDPAGDLDPLEWALLEGPGEVSAGGVYTFTAAADAPAGTHVVRVQVSDDDEGTAEAVFSVEVLPPDAVIEPDEPGDLEPAGCGCAASSGMGAGMWSVIGMLLLGRARRQRAAGLPGCDRRPLKL